MWLDQTLDVTVVGEASNSAEAMTLAQALHPQVVLVDLSTPPMDGITANATLRRAVLESAVVLLSLHDDSTMRARAQAAGAFTPVWKQEGVKALLAALKLAITSSVAVNPDVAGTIIKQAEHTGRTEQEGGCMLIALATHGCRCLQRLLMGSVTERVLRSTRLLLLIVRPQEKVARTPVKAKEKLIS